MDLATSLFCRSRSFSALSSGGVGGVSPRASPSRASLFSRTLATPGAEKQRTHQDQRTFLLPPRETSCIAHARCTNTTASNRHRERLTVGKILDEAGLKSSGLALLGARSQKTPVLFKPLSNCELLQTCSLATVPVRQGKRSGWGVGGNEHWAHPSSAATALQLRLRGKSAVPQEMGRVVKTGQHLSMNAPNQTHWQQNLQS